MANHSNTIERIVQRYVPDQGAEGCWIWIGTSEKDGYGVVQVKGRQWRAHRFIYESLVGKIPDGMQLDHLCRNRLCVNPAHLEPVTCAINIARSARSTSPVCAKGHLFSGKNLRIVQIGKYKFRRCLTCARIRMRGYRAQKKATG